MANVLNVISAVTPMGGTVAKLRLLMQQSRHSHVLYQPSFKNSEKDLLAEKGYYDTIGVPSYYSTYGRNALKNAWIIRDIVKKHNIDIIHLYFNHEQSFVPFLKVLCPKVKIVRSFVGYVPLSRINRSILAPCVGKNDYNVFISQYIKGRYENLFPILRKRNSSVIYNCPVKVKEAEDIDRDLVLYVGGLNKAKNVPLLIEMMNCVVNKLKRNDIKLTIVGDGPDRSLIEGMIERYGIKNNVDLLGYRKDIPELLNRAKVYVHSATNEGFGISVVEAMYMKCPCLIANASALPELVDEKSGFILPVDQPMEWAICLANLCDDENMRKEMGNNAFQRATDLFSMDQFVSNHDNLYVNLK